MNKEIINDKQAICLNIMFILGSTLLIGTGGGVAKRDTWIGVIISIIFTLPVMFIYSRILSLFHGKDLYQIVELIFGRVIGGLLSLAYIWFALHLGALVIRNYSEFTNVSVFPDTPAIVPSIFLIVICIWGVKQGIEVLGRWAEFFIITLMILVFFITIFLSSTLMDINNLRPVLEEGIKPVIYSAFISFTFPFGENVIFLLVYSSLMTKKSSYHVFYKGLCMGGLIIFLVTMRNLLVISAETLERIYFPSYAVVQLIRIGHFLQRVEVTVTIVFLISIYVKICICLLAVCKGLAQLFRFNDYRFLVVPVALLMLSLSIIVYSSTMEMVAWAFKVWPYYAVFFQIILPVIIYIGAELKVRKNKAI